jgi:hypothetical protein
VGSRPSLSQEATKTGEGTSDGAEADDSAIPASCPSRGPGASRFQPVRILREAGLVISEQGKGSFVRPQTTVIRLGNDRYSPKHGDTGLSPFLLEGAKQGKTGRFEVLSIDRVQPPADVAERLGVSARTKSVLRRENVFYADDDPAPVLAKMRLMWVLTVALLR